MLNTFVFYSDGKIPKLRNQCDSSMFQRWGPFLVVKYVMFYNKYTLYKWNTAVTYPKDGPASLLLSDHMVPSIFYHIWCRRMGWGRVGVSLGWVIISPGRVRMGRYLTRLINHPHVGWGWVSP